MLCSYLFYALRGVGDFDHKNFFQYPFYGLQFKVAEGDYLAHGKTEIISGKKIKVKLEIVDVTTQIEIEFSKPGYVILAGNIADNASQLYE